MTRDERTLYEALMADVGAPTVFPARPPWMADGACLEHPSVEFVPVNRGTEESADEARTICAACLCRRDCLAYALADPSLLGIWAGTTTTERRAMRRRRAA